MRDEIGAFGVGPNPRRAEGSSRRMRGARGCRIVTAFPRRSPDVEPDLTTPAALHDVLEALRAREPLFHRPEFGTGRADYQAMTAEDFWEVGASGRRYSRAHVLAVLEARRRDPQPDPWATRDFHCRELGTETYLLTYTLQQGARVTRRSTIWRRAPHGWIALFHQGTPVVQDAAP